MWKVANQASVCCIILPKDFEDALKFFANFLIFIKKQLTFIVSERILSISQNIAYTSETRCVNATGHSAWRLLFCNEVLWCDTGRDVAFQ